MNSVNELLYKNRYKIAERQTEIISGWNREAAAADDTYGLSPPRAPALSYTCTYTGSLMNHEVEMGRFDPETPRFPAINVRVNGAFWLWATFETARILCVPEQPIDRSGLGGNYSGTVFVFLFVCLFYLLY
jgi:hypothetical protein